MGASIKRGLKLLKMVIRFAVYILGFLVALGTPPLYGQIDSLLKDSLNTSATEKEFVNTLSKPSKKWGFKDDPIKFFDMAVFSTQKPFKSRKVKRQNLWKNMEHDCSMEIDQVPSELNNAFQGIHRSNQSSFFDLIKGNVRISNQIIRPTERQIMFSPYLTPGSSSQIFSCLSGLSYREEHFILNNADYFDIVLQNIKYLRDELKYSHRENVHSYKAILIRTKEEIRPTMKDPSKLGLILSIGGGHSLGNYLYLEQGQSNTPEYQEIVLSNVLKLKGHIPYKKNKETLLDIPIFSISFNNYFKDGICGKAAVLNTAENLAFTEPSNTGTGFTSMGTAVVATMLDKSKGRRILLDIGGISLKSREWYYKEIKNRRFKKDTIPILATGVGISGLSKKDNAYGKADKKSFLSHQGGNLCRQDLKNILESEGLISISLEINKLMGKSCVNRYNETVPFSAERHRVVIEAIVGNICKAIHMSNSIEAWDMLSICSYFDNHARHTEIYQTSADMVSLYRELLAFFNNPRPIEDLYTIKEIKNFMYDLSAEEIVAKLMYKNALRFLEDHFPTP
jgi:hypothetical protein